MYEEFNTPTPLEALLRGCVGVVDFVLTDEMSCRRIFYAYKGMGNNRISSIVFYTNKGLSQKSIKTPDTPKRRLTKVHN